MATAEKFLIIFDRIEYLSFGNFFSLNLQPVQFHMFVHQNHHVSSVLTKICLSAESRFY